MLCIHRTGCWSRYSCRQSTVKQYETRVWEQSGWLASESSQFHMTGITWSFVVHRRGKPGVGLEGSSFPPTFEESVRRLYTVYIREGLSEGWLRFIYSSTKYGFFFEKTGVSTALRPLSSLMFRIKIINDRTAVGNVCFLRVFSILKTFSILFYIFLHFLSRVFEY